jgi:parallel beta-helix repeat protein
MISQTPVRILICLCIICLQLGHALGQADIVKRIQSQLILAEDGDTIFLPAGTFNFTSTLSLDDKKGVVIKGAGLNQTILSFKGQKQGAEGMKITNAQDITLQDFTIEDAKGDLIKAQKVRGLNMFHILAQWTGKPSKHNGSYALYPVDCQQVKIANCTAIGASDAGIYVGQSDSVWVYDCTAHHNVAGIEIENTTYAWVYNNKAYQNTGGILIFDLPDLPKKKGGHVEVYQNLIYSNNYKNFAPKGNIVGKVPAGTGVMVLATNHVLIRDNLIRDNKTASCAIVSYFITESPIKDKDYYPYPEQIVIKANTFERRKRMPTLKNKLGVLFFLKFGRKTPHIMYDGIENDQTTAVQSDMVYHLCVSENKNGSFVNLKAAHKFKGMIKSAAAYTCKP